MSEPILKALKRGSEFILNMDSRESFPERSFIHCRKDRAVNNALRDAKKRDGQVHAESEPCPPLVISPLGKHKNVVS